MGLVDELPWSETPVWRSIDCGYGWYGLINKLNQDLLEIDSEYRVSQVKEKFGGLRYYTENTSKEMNNRIYEAERQSLQTCENCGSRESVMTKSDNEPYGWIRSLCDDCRKYFVEKRNNVN